MRHEKRLINHIRDEIVAVRDAISAVQIRFRVSAANAVQPDRDGIHFAITDTS